MAITGTQQPSSPSVQKQPSGNKVYTRVFKYARDDAWEAEMPAIGSLDGTYGYFRGYQSANSEAYVTVTLNYDTEGTVVNFSPADGDTESWAQTVGEEKPVEYHASYLVNWNYGLYAKMSLVIGGAVPDETDMPGGPGVTWANATDQTSLNGDAVWKWAKLHPGPEYRQIKKPTKNFDFYLAPTRVSFQRDYHRDKADAETDLKDVGKLVVPSEDFGATPSTTANWLVNSSSTQYDGKYWVTETEYWHSENGWDSDIYSVP